MRSNLGNVPNRNMSQTSTQVRYERHLPLNQWNVTSRIHIWDSNFKIPILVCNYSSFEQFNVYYKLSYPSQCRNNTISTSYPNFTSPNFVALRLFFPCMCFEVTWYEGNLSRNLFVEPLTSTMSCTFEFELCTPCGNEGLICRWF